MHEGVLDREHTLSTDSGSVSRGSAREHILPASNPKHSNTLLGEIKKTPYFQSKNFVLYNADCLSILKQLPENSVDMIFADPPYNLSNGGFTVHAGKRVNVHKGDWDVSQGLEKDFEFHIEWIRACRRVLKPEGTLWISW